VNDNVDTATHRPLTDALLLAERKGVCPLLDSVQTAAAGQ
jgi:hypothetical protein